jgi:hyperosmotically inducible protein
MKNLTLSFGVTAAMLLASTGSPAATTSAASDVELGAKAARQIRTYPRYTIWDFVDLRVVEGNIELAGHVSQPFKKADLERLMQRLPGVKSVTNRLEVLPLSRFDDDLRIAVARAIYRDPALSRYALQAVPPIHIIVKNGQVTLQGVVNNELEKNVAGLRAATAGLSLGAVVNNLSVENAKPRG